MPDAFELPPDGQDLEDWQGQELDCWGLEDLNVLEYSKSYFKNYQRFVLTCLQ